MTTKIHKNFTAFVISLHFPHIYHIKLWKVPLNLATGNFTSYNEPKVLFKHTLLGGFFMHWITYEYQGKTQLGALLPDGKNAVSLKALGIEREFTDMIDFISNVTEE